MPRKTLLSFALVGIILGFVTDLKVFFFLSGLIIFIYLGFERFADIIGEILERIVRTIGNILSKIFLTISFILVVIPVGFLYRRKHHNPLQLNIEKLKTAFVDREAEYTPQSIENTW